MKNGILIYLNQKGFLSRNSGELLLNEDRKANNQLDYYATFH